MEKKKKKAFKYPEYHHHHEMKLTFIADLLYAGQILYAVQTLFKVLQCISMNLILTEIRIILLLSLPITDKYTEDQKA